MHGYTFMTPRGGGYASGKGDPWKVGETRASEPEPYVASVDPWGALALAGPTDTVLCLVELGGERRRDPWTSIGPVQRLVTVTHMEEGLRRFAAQFADEAYRRVCDEGSAGVHRPRDAQRAAFNDPAQPWVKRP